MTVDKIDPKEICEYIDSQKESAMELWEQIVRIESPSNKKENVDYLASHLDTYLSALGMHTEKIGFEKAGSSLVAWTDPGEKEPVAILGHIDTVHPVGAFGENPFVMDGEYVYGPGVYDCKGGVAAGILAIRALKHFGYSERQIRLILSGDEEVAHALSGDPGRAVYTENAKGCIAGFNCESGFLNGDIVTARKGGGIVTVKVHGVPAHTGREPEKGASGIRAAAQMIVKIEEKSNPEKVLFNCGLIKGGSSANVVPEFCEFSIALRFHENEEYRKSLAFLQDLCENQADSRVTATLTEDALFPAMEKTEGTSQLFKKYQESCKKLGLSLPEGVYSGGCSDASFLTMMGIPVLCGVGVRGADNHSRKERAVVSSLTESAKKMVLTILKL